MPILKSEKYFQSQALVTQSAKIMVVAIAYLILGWLSTPFPVWFPAGLGLAALLLWGQVVGLGIFSGDFLLNLILGETWEYGIVSALGSTFGAMVGLNCLRYFRFSPHFLSLKDVLSLVFWAALLATTINATLTTLWQFHHSLSGSNLQLTWLRLWLGDSAGVILITPFLLHLRYDWRSLWHPQSKWRLFEAFLCLGLLDGVGWLVFDAQQIKMDALINHFSTTQYLEYLPFPFVIWAAIRFSIWGAVGANLLVVLLAMTGTATGVGTFILQTPNDEQAILLLQIFLIILSTTSLCLAAAINERQQLNSTLEEQVIERTLQLQEKIQETQQLSQMKTIFLQAIAHDLRTSTLGLSMLLKNLQNHSKEPSIFSNINLDRIIQSSDRQLTLINALAEEQFSKQNGLSLHLQNVSLAEIVNNLSSDFTQLFDLNKITLKNQISTDLPKIKVDSQQIRLVYEHLLTNAIKHNPPGLEITLDATMEDHLLKCTILDNGVGMTPQQCQQLFKLYVRNQHNQRLTGIGLGSYQCRQIIEAHGGQIGVKSALSLGTQFWFTVPLAD